MKLSNVIGGLVLVSAAGFGLSHLLKTGSTGKKISVSITGVTNPKIQGAALILGVDVGMDNPTNNSLTLKKPYITALYNGNEVGNSIPSNETITIKANDRTIIRGINIQIPIVKLGTLALTLIVGKLPKFSVDIKMRTEANGIPYTDTQHFDL